MKNKIAISFILCFLLAYVGCKKAEPNPVAPPIVQTDDSNYFKGSHYTQQDLADYLASKEDKKKCNNCHATK